LTTAGQGLIPADNPFLCAKFNKHPQGLSLIFFDGFEVQDVRFPTNQVSSNLDFIWSFKSAVKPKVSKLPIRVRMYSVLCIFFLKLYFDVSLVFLHILGP